MKKGTKASGDYGEDLAAAFLQDSGYQILERNFRYGHGEIDIVASKDGWLVFVEVKLRRNLEYGRPEESVSQSKRKQIRKVASAYMFEKNIEEVDTRFDFVGIVKEGGKPPEIIHLENAF